MNELARKYGCANDSLCRGNGDQCGSRPCLRALGSVPKVGASIRDSLDSSCRGGILTKPFLTVEPVEWVSGLPEAIICDIDGTLAHMTDRSPYDYSAVLTDVLDKTIEDILYAYKLYTGGKVFIVSGRDHTCRTDTVKWLNDNSVTYDRLFMRDADRRDDRGNKIPDYVIKYEIFNREMRGKYNIAYVLDDRKQVVDMWRKLGLKCLQVAEGDF